MDISLKRESGENPELTRSGKRERVFKDTANSFLWEVEYEVNHKVVLLSPNTCQRLSHTMWFGRNLRDLG